MRVASPDATLVVLRAVFVLVALLALPACSSEPADCRGHFRADASLTPAMRARVASAFGKWNAAAGRTELVLEDAGQDDGTCSVRVDERASSDLGLWDPNDGTIALAPERLQREAPGCAGQLDDCIEAVALHEAGHALGLSHVPDEHHVMSATGELVLDLTDEDRDVCVRAGACQ
jgi:hypothetical protein